MLFGTLMEAYLTYLQIHIWIFIRQWLLNALMMEKNLWSLSDMTFTPKTYLKVKNLTLHLGICLNFVPFSRFWIHVKNYLLGESIHMLVHKNDKLGIRRDYGFVKFDASGTKVNLLIVLHRVWKNWASSGLEHARKWKFEPEHARALENSTWSSFYPGIWLKMHYFCQNLPIFKGSFASSIKKSSIEHARASKIDFGRAFFGLEHARVQH